MSHRIELNIMVEVEMGKVEVQYLYNTFPHHKNISIQSPIRKSIFFKILYASFKLQLCNAIYTSLLSEEIRIQRGARQGCVASPTRFNLYTGKIFRHIINMKGVNVGGTHYKHLRYADDTALLEVNEKELSELTSRINEVGNNLE